MEHTNVVLAVTGASGAIYALRLLETMLAAEAEVHLCVSPSARLVLRHELDLDVDLDAFDPLRLLRETFDPARHRAAVYRRAAEPPFDLCEAAERIRYHHYQNLTAPIASGSFLTAGMAICPCSGSTLGAVVHGTGENLIHRAAQVHLKERRPLIVAPRETPLSIIQLDNMKRAAEAGAVVLPAMPGFYHGVESLADLVDFVVARVCDQLKIPHSLMRRWGSY